MKDDGQIDLEQILLTNRARLLRRIEMRIGLNPFADFAAEDVLQDAFADAHRVISTLTNNGNTAIIAWLEKIVDNRLAQTFRDRARLKRGGPNWQSASADSSIQDLAHDIADSGVETGSARMLKREIKVAIRDAIQDLPEQQERVMNQYYLQQQPLEQIAESEQLTKSAVRGLIYRAKLTIKKVLGNSSRWYSKK